MSKKSNQFERLIETTRKLQSAIPIVSRIESRGEAILEVARPMLALMELGRIQAATVTESELRVQMRHVECTVELADSCFKAAAASNKKAGLALNKIRMFERVATADSDMQEAQKDFDEAIWFANSGIEEIEALYEQIEEYVADLDRVLPL